MHSSKIRMLANGAEHTHGFARVYMCTWGEKPVMTVREGEEQRWKEMER